MLARAGPPSARSAGLGLAPRGGTGRWPRAGIFGTTREEWIESYAIIFVLHRKTGMDQQEFARYWREQHVPLVAALPGVRRYRIAPVTADAAAQAPFAGIGELWFDTEADWRKALDSPEGRRAVQDVAAFQERSEGAAAEPEIVWDRRFRLP